MTVADEDVWQPPKTEGSDPPGRIDPLGNPDLVLVPGSVSSLGAFLVVLRVSGRGVVVSTLPLGLTSVMSALFLGTAGLGLTVLAGGFAVWGLVVAWLSLRKLAAHMPDAYRSAQVVVELHAHHLVARDSTRLIVPIAGIQSVQTTKDWAIVRTAGYPDVLVIPNDPTFIDRLRSALSKVKASEDFVTPDGLRASYRAPSRLGAWVQLQRRTLGWPARVSVLFFVVMGVAMASTGEALGISVAGIVVVMLWFFFSPSALIALRVQSRATDSYLAGPHGLSWRANGWGWDVPWDAVTPGKNDDVAFVVNSHSIVLRQRDLVDGDHDAFVARARSLAEA